MLLTLCKHKGKKITFTPGINEIIGIEIPKEPAAPSALLAFHLANEYTAIKSNFPLYVIHKGRQERREQVPPSTCCLLHFLSCLLHVCDSSSFQLAIELASWITWLYTYKEMHIPTPHHFLERHSNVAAKEQSSWLTQVSAFKKCHLSSE